MRPANFTTRPVDVRNDRNKTFFELETNEFKFNCVVSQQENGAEDLLRR